MRSLVGTIVLGSALLTAGCSDPREIVVTQAMSSDILGAIRDKTGLSVEEVQAVSSYQQRLADAKQSGDAVPAPVGKTIGQLIREQQLDSQRGRDRGFITPPPAVRLGQRKLLPGKVNGKYGYFDRTGKLVIPAQFDSAHDFYEGLAAVCIGNCDFKTVKKLKYLDVASVKLWDGKWGYIDESGKYVVNPQYEGISDFNEGLAAVCQGEECDAMIFDSDYTRKHASKWGFIDRSGKLAINPQFEAVKPFADGLAGACMKDCGNAEKERWGFIDRRGSVKISAQFDEVSSFWDGIAKVRVGSAKDQRWGYIDMDGKFVINPQ